MFSDLKTQQRPRHSKIRKFTYNWARRGIVCVNLRVIQLPGTILYVNLRAIELLRTILYVNLRTMELPNPIVHVNLRTMALPAAPEFDLEFRRSKILDRGAFGDAKMSTTLAF